MCNVRRYVLFNYVGILKRKRETREKKIIAELIKVD